MRNILDVACGPGGWVFDIARLCPDAQVVGLDISKQMIAYARMQAKAQGITNVEFHEMNALKPLEFPTGSFDLVNGRFLGGFVPTGLWPALVRECVRVARPGGIVRLSDNDGSAGSTSLWTERMSAMIAQALKKSGLGFSPDGRSFAITPMLKRLLQMAGCTQIKLMPFLIDYSAGTDAHDSFYQNFKVATKLLQPFLARTGAATEEEFDNVYLQMLRDMQSEDFCALWVIVSVWGIKPEASL
jgi:ubiquinone/menaquinone biosynthesis C-methylase UbiE